MVLTCIYYILNQQVKLSSWYIAKFHFTHTYIHYLNWKLLTVASVVVLGWKLEHGQWYTLVLNPGIQTGSIAFRWQSRDMSLFVFCDSASTHPLTDCLVKLHAYWCTSSMMSLVSAKKHRTSVSEWLFQRDLRRRLVAMRALS